MLCPRECGRAIAFDPDNLKSDRRVGAQVFKMRDAASLSGEFRRFTPRQLDDRLRQLARIINRHAEIVIWAILDLQAHDEA